MIGQRLKLARQAAGMTMRELAQRIEGRVTAQAICKYEHDRAMPGSAVLLALADALDVPLDYLVGDPDLSLESVDFRKPPGATGREQARLKALVLRSVERYLAIEGLLNLPSLEWRTAPRPVNRSLREAGRAADSLRRDWSLGTDPIPNLVELLEERGIKVLLLAPQSMDGLTAKVRRRGRHAVPVILCSDRRGGGHQRQALARELGHLVMKVGGALDAGQAATRFAGAFLMPAHAIRAAIGRHRSDLSLSELSHLAQLFGTDIQAIARRCRDLDIINAALRDRLSRRIADLAWRHAEPATIPPEHPTRFARLTCRALSERAITESRAAELLDTTASNLHQHLSPPTPAAHNHQAAEA